MDNLSPMGRRFRDLPNEVILLIQEFLDEDSDGYWDWAAFARVNRRCFELINPILYMRSYADALNWAVDDENDGLPILQAVLRYITPAEIAQVKAHETILIAPDWVCLRGNLPGYRDRMKWHDWREQIPEGSASWEASLLHVACANGDMYSTRFLIEVGADIHDAVQRFCPCLHLEDQIKLNHDGGGEIFDGAIPKWLPLHHALCGQNPEVALLLLEKGASLCVTAPDDRLVTALHSSAAHGAVEVVRYLLQRHHDDPTEESSPDEPDDYGYTALHYLSLCYDSEAVLSIAQQLIDAGLSVDVKSSPDEDHEDVFERDADEFSGPFYPATAFGLACFLGNFVAAKALLQLRADKSTDVNGSNCLELCLAAQFTTWSRSRQDYAEWQKDRLYVVTQLILAGISADPFGLVSPLMHAAKSGAHNEMALLLDFCWVDVARGDENGMTALHHAVRHARPRAVECLLEKGADVNVMDRFCLSPVYGLQHGRFQDDDQDDTHMRRLEVLHLLLRYGANFGLPGENNTNRDNQGILSGMPLDFDYGRDAPTFSSTMLGSEIASFLEEGRHNFFPIRDEEYDISEILKLATPANISYESFQSAVLWVISPSCEDPSQVDVKRRIRMTRMLSQFGSRVGYLFDDNTSNRLSAVITQSLKKEELASPFIKMFFAMGDGDGVPTNTGVFTPEAMLVLAILADSKMAVRKLLTNKKCSVRGIIPCLGNSTLLHLAAIAQGPEDVVNLLKSHGSEIDVNAVTNFGSTALSTLIDRDEHSPAFLEAIEHLLALGADPYFCCQDPIDPMTKSESVVQNLIEPRCGKPLSRCAATLIGQSLVFRRHAKSKKRPLVFPRPSFLEVAIQRNRLDVVKEIAKCKPKTAEQLANVAGCGRLLLKHLDSGYEDMVCQLLRMGADPSLLDETHREMLTRPPYSLVK